MLYYFGENDTWLIFTGEKTIYIRKPYDIDTRYGMIYWN